MITLADSNPRRTCGSTQDVNEEQETMSDSKSGGATPAHRDRSRRTGPGQCRLFRRGPLAVAAALLLACTLSGAASAVAKPSIVLVLTDDMEVGLVEHMPKVKELIVERGASFARAYFNLPLCCPSRATILTGRYAHNTGVTANNHAQFYDAGLHDETIAVWLKAAGYRTALVGKYLNNYPKPAPEDYVPPGWDYWVGRFPPGPTVEDYRLNEDGRVVAYGKGAENHPGDVYAAKALGFVRRALADGAPFFLELSVHAPHAPATPAPRHAGMFAGLRAPRPPSFDEPDVGDKPAFIRALAPLSAERVAEIDELYRNRARSLQAVDEAVAAIVGALEEAGRLYETYLVFASDNGYLQGLHRANGKGLPYEEVVRMPLYVRGPGVEPGLVLEHLVGNVDLAPTFAEWAGAAVPEDVDGRSLAPLLGGEGAPEPEAWRRAYPLTFTKTRSEALAPGWRGVRTRSHLYVEYATGEQELYDMRTDQYQLENLAGAADPALLAALSRLTAALGSCSGTECHRLEDAPF
jgi:arylsulfatase A-like enzyme